MTNLHFKKLQEELCRNRDIRKQIADHTKALADTENASSNLKDETAFAISEHERLLAVIDVNIAALELAITSSKNFNTLNRETYENIVHFPMKRVNNSKQERKL